MLIDILFLVFAGIGFYVGYNNGICLLYTSDAADDLTRLSFVASSSPSTYTIDCVNTEIVYQTTIT